MAEPDSETGSTTNVRRRAAQYVRMSTEHQRYSTENQADAIAAYAAARGFVIVRTYADEGKSGLSLDGRDALRRLITDVREGRTDFEAVLVYDVSRWGRFQDADEGAALEFLCREAGIAVHYCAEQFENDGSLSATIIKSMKRAMAGEYSRELSAKVFAGQCRLVELGFRQGGPAGYGLRRRLLDEARQPKAALARGERKSLQTDRVVLEPGPSEEVETVRRIYRLFVDERRGEAEIAALLNREGRPNDRGHVWTRAGVHQVLTNEKYVGRNVYNRVSRKLKGPRVVNPPEAVLRVDHAFPPLVDAELFERARRIVAERSRRLTDEQMLDRLRILLDRRGWLSGLVIDETDDMPSSSAYRSRFGTLVRAYRLIGWAPGRDYAYLEINKALRRVHRDVVSTVVAGLEHLGALVEVDPDTDRLLVNEELTASVAVARATSTGAGALRWKVRFDVALQPDLTIAVRLDETNTTPLDYYLLPRLDFGDLARLRFAQDNGVFLDAYRSDDLQPLFRLLRRSPLRSAA